MAKKVGVMLTVPADYAAMLLELGLEYQDAMDAYRVSRRDSTKGMAFLDAAGKLAGCAAVLSEMLQEQQSQTIDPASIN